MLAPPVIGIADDRSVTLAQFNDLSRHISRLARNVGDAREEKSDSPLIVTLITGRLQGLVVLPPRGRAHL